MNSCNYTKLYVINDTEKKIIDNSVRYIPKSEQTKGRDIKANSREKNTLSRKQDKKFARNNKKFPMNISASGFKFPN